MFYSELIHRNGGPKPKRNFRFRKDGGLDMRYKLSQSLGQIDFKKKVQSRNIGGQITRRKAPMFSRLGCLVLVLSLLLVLWSAYRSRPKTPLLVPVLPVREVQASKDPLSDLPEHCRGKYEIRICEKDWNSEIMIAVMCAESRRDPEAINTRNRNGTYDSGLFQINSIHGYKNSSLFYWESNIDIAYEVWERSGYTAWAAFNDGSYAEYLGVGCK